MANPDEKKELMIRFTATINVESGHYSVELENPSRGLEFPEVKNLLEQILEDLDAKLANPAAETLNAGLELVH